MARTDPRSLRTVEKYQKVYLKNLAIVRFALYRAYLRTARQEGSKPRLLYTGAPFIWHR